MIRNCKVKDINSIIELFKEGGVYDSAYDNYYTLKSKIKKQPDSILIYERNEIILGVILIIFDPWVSFVFHACVKEGCRDTGIGRALIEAAEKRIKEKETSGIAGYIVKSNDLSRTVAKRLGFNEFDKDVICVYKYI